MKKILCLLFALVLPLSVFAACKEKSDAEVFTMYVPDGAPLLSVATVADGGAAFGSDRVNVQMVTGTQVAPALLAKTPDIALAPINACATAFNKTDGDYVLCGVSVWGLNFIVSKDENKTALNDFVGETIYAFQETGTPGITLKALIKMFGLEYKVITADDKSADPAKINIMFLPDASKVRDALLGTLAEVDGAKHGVLSEPVVTAMQAAVKSTVSTQELWEEKTGASYPQVGLVVRKSLAENRKDDVTAFVNYLAEQAEYICENPAEAATIVKDKLESTALPAATVCQNFIASERGQAAFAFGKTSEVKTAVKNYLEKLAEVQGLSIVGGAQPADGFYFAG